MWAWRSCWSRLVRPGRRDDGVLRLYVWHGLLIYVIVRRLTGFRWSAANRRTGLLFLPLIGAVFCGFLVLPVWAATTFGGLAALLTGIYSLRVVCRLVSVDRIPSFLRPLLG